MVPVYELYKKVKALCGEHAALEDAAAIGHTRLTPEDQEIAPTAADFRLDHGLPFSDALNYATARRHHAELYTSDAPLRHHLWVRSI